MDGLQQSKVIQRATSPSNSFLHLSYDNKVYSVKDKVNVQYNTVNSPNTGHIFYMVRHNFMVAAWFVFTKKMERY